MTKAQLRYTTDRRPGLTRRRRGKGFVYLDAKGHIVRSPSTLTRIRSLAIPPAYTRVWICPDAQGHLQATGYDQRGRKQYRYHPRWRAVRDENKFDRMTSFAKVLPKLRRRVQSDLSKPGMPREKVLATIVHLLERTCIRVGNDEYAQQNGSYGLTTLRNRHVSVRGPTTQFRFRGKSGKQHVISIDDRRVARVVKRCRDLPGQELFVYEDDDGKARRVNSTDVNDFIREITKGDFTAKDFRTWNATTMATSLLRRAQAARKLARRSLLKKAVQEVAQSLGNTPAICLKCYIHPTVVECFTNGSLSNLLNGCTITGKSKLSQDETAVLVLLTITKRSKAKLRLYDPARQRRSA